MHFDQTTIAYIVLGVVILILLAWIIRLEIKLRRFLVGSGARNLEDSLKSLTSDMSDFSDFRKDLEEYLTQVEKRLRRSMQAVHTLRFNPFKGTGSGGNQSFATVIVNEDGDGVILSSLYSRDHVSVFSKPVKNHTSEFELSEEEQEALARAKQSLGKITLVKE
jgi:hypothetical protein